MPPLTELPEIPADPHPRIPRWVTDVVISTMVIVLAFVQPPIAEFRSTGILTTILMLAPVAILPLRRRWPIPVLIALLALFGGAAAAGTLSPGIGFAVAVAMFQVALTTPQRRGIIIGGAAVVGIMLLTLLASIGSVIDPRAFQFGLFVAFAAAAGGGTRSRIAYISAINERAERAVQTREAEAHRRVSEERLRIARDLHDAVAHQIAVISLHAGVASSMIQTRPEKAQESLATIRTAARTVLGEIGDLMTMLRSEDDSSPSPQPPAGLDRIDDLVAVFAASGLEVHVRVEGDPADVTGAVGLVAYRVVQEALTNAHKHGAEHRAHVLIEVTGDTVTLTVTNPMAGPSEEPDAATAGLGLVGLRERVASVRGTVEAGPAPAGWRVSARLPRGKEQS